LDDFTRERITDKLGLVCKSFTTKRTQEVIRKITRLKAQDEREERNSYMFRTT